MKDLLGRDIPDDQRIEVVREVLAEALWEYGEDDLAQRALSSTDHDLEQIARLALWHRLNDPDPVDGPRITNGRIHARGAIEYFELDSRDTTRTRRRRRPREQRYDAALLVDSEGDA